MLFNIAGLAIYISCHVKSLLWTFGLDLQLDGILVAFFVSHFFVCFYDLKLVNTITVAPRMVSFGFVYHKLSETVTFVDFL